VAMASRVQVVVSSAASTHRFARVGQGEPQAVEVEGLCLDEGQMRSGAFASIPSGQESTVGW
jgi:hypothetical protein